MPLRIAHLMCPRLSCSRMLSLRDHSRQKSGKVALAVWNSLSAPIITGLSVCAVPCIPLAPNPFKTGLPVLVTAAAAPVCPGSGGEAGGGLAGAAGIGGAGTVGDVTMTAGCAVAAAADARSGAADGTSVTVPGAAPGAAIATTGTPAVGASLAGGAAGMVPCTRIEEPGRAASASADDGVAADCEHPPIGSAVKPRRANPAIAPSPVLPACHT